jgi:iron complex outermembrane receptor protein
MIQEKILSRSMRVMFAGGALLGMASLAQPAFAQEQKVEAVYVTGTRITTPGTTSNSPISSIGAEEIKSSQPVAVEEFFRGLPAAVPAMGPSTNNGSAGAATIDLRGLGTNRTLVLINGRRLVPYNLGGTVDTNSIPVALISRVDLVTGGASVVYGADAVSGVVNFNLKRNFTGVDISTSYGMSGDSDAKRKRTDLTMGASLPDNKGNVVLSLGTTKVDPLTAGERPIGQTTLSSANGLFAGSGTTVPGVVSIPRGTGLTDAASGVMSGNWQMDPATGKFVNTVVGFNTNPPNYFQTGLDRQQATALANYKINEHAELYTEIFYTQGIVASALASSGTFGNTYNMPIGNPYLPQAARQQICDRRGIPAASCVEGNPTIVPVTSSRRFTELGPRFNNFENKTLQYHIGVKGEIAYDWNYDATWSRGAADQTQIRKNWGSLSKVTQALNALNKTTCTNTANGCVPLNIFGAEGSIPQNQLDFINLSSLLLQKVQQDVAAVSFSGDLGNKIVSPFAASPINMSISLEQRKVSASTQSDGASQIQSEVLGTGAPTPDRKGNFSLKEAAVEMLVPLVKDKPFIEAMNLEMGYRQSEFETAGKSQSYGSWKVGGEWSPIKALRLRAMSQKATRAPNVNELFAPQVTGLSNLATDPCQLALVNKAQANTAGTLSNLCRLTGVPADVLGTLAAPSSGQINNLTGGNPNLSPEEAKTQTIGFVWEPVAKLAISLDYYKIKIDKAVSSLSTTDVLEGCYSAAKNPGLVVNEYCNIVGRDPNNGSFNGSNSRGVFTASSNAGNQSTSGYDLNVAYKVAAKQMGMADSMGALDISFGLNQVQTFLFQGTPNSVNRDCLGYYSTACGNVQAAPSYKRKFNQRSTWNVSDFSVGYNWRYVSSVIEEPGGAEFFPAYTKIPAYSYVDLNAVYNFNKKIRFNLSIVNAFDKAPPLVGNTIATTSMTSGNTFPNSYDTFGRYFTFGASVKF